MSLKKLSAFCFLLSISLVSSHSGVPHLGSASDALWSKKTELSIGKAAYNYLERNGKLYHAAADLDYLNYLGNKVADYAKTRLGLTFYLTRSTNINAFASPGGYVGVNAGLILATDNEHELAGVLAHETGHVVQEHIARSILAAKNRSVGNAAAIVASILLASQGGGRMGTAALSAVLAGEQQSRINDIRRHEIEADRIGRKLMTKAGFNELGMQTFFAKLYVPSSLNNAPSYLLTHPLPRARQAAIDTLKKRSKHLVSRDEYYLFRARIQNEFLDDKQIQHLILQSQQQQNPQIKSAGNYLKALQAIKQGKIDTAIGLLNQLKASMRNNRDVRLLKAKCFLLKNQPAHAEKIYQQLWSSYRGDSIIAYDYAQFLMQSKRLKKAEKLLEKQIDNTQTNAQLFWLYGKILGKLGKTTQQQQMLIRYYQQSGEYESALNQVNIALNNDSLDWKQRAILNSKKKELESLMRHLD